MNKRLSSFIAVSLLIVILAVTALAGCQSAPAAPAEKEDPNAPIKFGMLTDLTGPSAQSSKPFTDSMVEYFEYMNSKGGINGHPMEFVMVDTKYDINLAAAGFEKLCTQDKVPWIYGGSANFQSVIKPLATKYKTCFYCTSDQAALLPVNADLYNFGMNMTYSDQWRASLTYLKENWKKAEAPRIGFIGLDVAFSKSAIKTTKWMLENELKWPLVAEEYMALTATDASAQVTNLKNAKCDYVFMASTGVPQIVFLKTAKALGLSDQTTIVDTYLCGMAAFRAAAPDAMDGVITHVTTADVTMADKYPKIKDLEKLCKENRPNVVFDWLTIAAYGVTASFQEVASRVYKKHGFANMTGPNYKAAAEGMTGWDWDGIFAPCAWSPTCHDGPHACFIVKNKPKAGFDVLAWWYKMPDWPAQYKTPSFFMQ